MADYQKMYTLLCGAISSALDVLEQTPDTHAAISILQSALDDAEEIYISGEDE